MSDFFIKKQGKTLYFILLVLGVFLGFRFLLPLITPFLVAFILVYTLNPALKKLQRKTHIRKEIMIAGLLLLLAAGLLFAVWCLIQWVILSMPSITAFFGTVRDQAGMFLKDCCQLAESKTGLNALRMEQLVIEKAEVFIESLQVDMMPKLVKESWWYVKGVLSLLAFLGISVISAIMLCKDYDSIIGKMKESESLDMVFELIERLFQMLSAYIRAQAVIIAVIIIICCLGLLYAKVDYWLPLGLLAGILDVLPFIGTGVVLVPSALWLLLTGNISGTVILAVAYVLCIISREILEPKLMGEGLGIYPVVMLFAVFAGVKLFGVSGIIKGPLAVVVIMEGAKRIFKKAEDHSMED